jgi:hypothetical protein
MIAVVHWPLNAVLGATFLSYELGWGLAAFISARRGEPSWAILAAGVASGLVWAALLIAAAMVIP